jgi:hypothetical protein
MKIAASVERARAGQESVASVLGVNQNTVGRETITDAPARTSSSIESTFHSAPGVEHHLDEIALIRPASRAKPIWVTGRAISLSAPDTKAARSRWLTQNPTGQNHEAAACDRPGNTEGRRASARAYGRIVHTITVDNGKEFAAHQNIGHVLKVKISLATPYYA